MRRAKEEEGYDCAVDASLIVAERTAVSGRSDREDESVSADGTGGAPPPHPASATASTTNCSVTTPASEWSPPGGSVLFVPGDNIHQPMRRESNGNGDDDGGDGAGASSEHEHHRETVAIRIEDAIVEHAPQPEETTFEIGHAEPVDIVTFCGKEMQSTRRSFIIVIFSLVILILVSIAISVSIYFANNNTSKSSDGNVPDQPPSSLLDREFATLNDTEKAAYYREFLLSLSPQANLSDPYSSHLSTLIWLDSCGELEDCALLFDSNKPALIERYAWNMLWSSTRGVYWSASQGDSSNKICDWKVDSYQCNADERVTEISLGTFKKCLCLESSALQCNS
jgi:hypothetical protein